ncbi:efflux RND transporter periplasmic adaptor subunit [Sporolactobacillus sp. Y61]|uniref:Efflux RND transporter periplasmic adaptor subunit n=1 Tax=Sporolactobacillus sp. Y61 TaxID=3160863 RepID=A0AAU8IFH1_9BACL
MKKGWMIFLAVILVAGGSTFWLLSRDRTIEAQTLYPITTVQEGTLSSDVSGSGQLEPATDEDILIDSDDASKTVDSVNVSSGDTVEKGDTLLTFTDGTTLEAPNNGTITSVKVYEGDRLSAGRAVFHLTDYSDLNTVIQIDELDISKIKKGQSVSVTVNAFSDKTFSGKVTAIARTGSNTNGVSSFDVTIHIDKPSGLKPGMTATASIVIEKKDHVLYVPSGAVHEAGGQYYVYRSSGTEASDQEQNGFSGRGMSMDQQRGSQTAVQTGIHNDQYIEITSGLEQGDRIQLSALSKQSGTTSSGQNQTNLPGMNGGGQGPGSEQGMRMRMNGGGGNGQ